MRVWLSAGVLLTAACVSAPPTKPVDSEEAVAPVIAAERAFAARHQQVSVKQAFQEFSADEGVAVRPDGVKNVKEDLARWPEREDAGFIQWWPAFAGVARSGEFGFTTGPASYGGGKSFSNYFTLWKKQPDGSWKWVIDQGTGQTEVAPVHPRGERVTVVPVSVVEPMEPGAAWKELLALDTALGAAMGADASALAARLAPDVRMLGFGQPPASGAVAIQAVLASRPSRITMKPEGGGVSAAGDLGWTYGYASWEEGGAPRRGPYLRAWQRRPIGWVILVDNLTAFRP